jgi:hypothetical protein
MGTGAVPEHAGRKLGRGHFLRAAEEYLPTGGQFGIVHGDQSAIVTEVGATLRSFPVAGLELLVTFGVADGPLPRIFQVYTGDTLP